MGMSTRPRNMKKEIPADRYNVTEGLTKGNMEPIQELNQALGEDPASSGFRPVATEILKSTKSGTTAPSVVRCCSSGFAPSRRTKLAEYFNDRSRLSKSSRLRGSTFSMIGGLVKRRGLLISLCVHAVNATDQNPARDETDDAVDMGRPNSACSQISRNLGFAVLVATLGGVLDSLFFSTEDILVQELEFPPISSNLRCGIKIKRKEITVNRENSILIEVVPWFQEAE